MEVANPYVMSSWSNIHQIVSTDFTIALGVARHSRYHIAKKCGFEYVIKNEKVFHCFKAHSTP